MRSYTGKLLYAVWQIDSLFCTKKIAALTRVKATEIFRELYNLTEKEVADLKLTRVKSLWSTKEGIIK